MKLNIPNLLDSLEEVLKDDKTPKPDEKRQYRHNPSSASLKIGEEVVGACLRQLYYRATELPVSNPQNFTSMLTAGFGTAIHDWFFKRLQENPKLKIDPEVKGKAKVDPLTLEISYRVDGLVTHKGEKGGAELKTKHGYSLQKKLQDSGPYWEDLAQIVTYFELEKELLWYILVYVGRDSGYRAEYHIYRDYDDGMKLKIKPIVPDGRATEIKDITFEKIKERWLMLEYYLDNKTVPPRDYKMVLKEDGTPTKERTKNKKKIESDKRCLYCNWQTYCWTQPDAYNASYNLEYFSENSK